MKKTLKKCGAFLLSVVTAVSVSFAAKSTENQAVAATNVIAFPGAVGGGKYATGGRGGEVVHVTNLNDSGEGSFREAVSKSNRIVVFDVSGTIELKSNILVQSNITIAGQTAPGGSGITLKNFKMGMSGDNIICRYVSSRPGPYKATSSGNDAWGGAKGSNSIIDHCSMGWTTDEQWGLYSNNQYYTVQYSVIGPADSWGGHSKGIHGFGLMMGKGYSTFDHNLIIHNVSRNFRGKVEGTQTADFTNNIIYDWAYQTAYGTIGHLNYVNNTLKMGNGTTGGKHYVNVDSSTKPENFKIYLSGNRMLNKDNSVYDQVTADNWNGISVKDGLGITKDGVKSGTAFETIVGGENVSTALTCESAEKSYDHVISFAGNGISPDLRTAIDKQCAEETRTGTGYISGTAAYDDADSSQKANLDKYQIQCGTEYKYPSAVTKKTIVDSDNDGMPDDWELARGLNPNDPKDTTGDYCGQGYTNIEYYINDLTVNSFPEGVVTPSPEMQVKTISAFENIEAEDFSDQSGIKTEDCADGGKNVGYIENGDYIVFNNVDFENGAKSITAKLAGNKSNIEIYLDKIGEKPLAVLPFEGTGGFQEWKEFSYNIADISGVHNLYLKFIGGEGFLLNIDKFRFSKENIPLNGRLVKNLKALDQATSGSWAINSNLQADGRIFGDRDFTFTEMPEKLIGAEAILTPCDAKNAQSDIAVFTAAEDITVYILLDNRVSTVPTWLGDWNNTDLTALSSNDVTFVLYSRNFKSGEDVTLGANGQSAYCVNYGVIVTEQKTEEKTIYDLNGDDTENIEDIILLQRYLVKYENFETAQFKTADVNKDGKVNVFDLCILKRRQINS